MGGNLEPKSNMSGAGYNIPISLSLAETYSVPQTMLTPTYFVFGAGNKVGGDIEQNPQNINPATATSATAQNGNASAETSDSGVKMGGAFDTKTVLIFAGVALGLYLLRHRF